MLQALYVVKQTAVVSPENPVIILGKLTIVTLQCFHVLALDLEGVHDVKLHHPSSSVATANQ